MSSRSRSHRHRRASLNPTPPVATPARPTTAAIARGQRWGNVKALTESKDDQQTEIEQVAYVTKITHAGCTWWLCKLKPALDHHHERRRGSLFMSPTRTFTSSGSIMRFVHNLGFPIPASSSNSHQRLSNDNFETPNTVLDVIGLGSEIEGI